MATAEPTPREFGRDGVSGILNPSRVMRARDVSRPSPADVEAAEASAEAKLARARRRR